MSETLLSVEGLAATYNHAIAAVSDVSLAVRRGEIVAVLGANGAGKSTTLQAISALLAARRGQISAGRIVFDGRDVAGTSAATLVRAGLVPVLEGRHCFASLTVEENLITGAIGRDARRAEIAADIERAYQLFPRLKQHRRALAGLTSGGEQQMTAIGRALMSRPRLLVLDEPSMGLAPLVVEGIFRALQQLNGEQGLSILIAEQNSTVALRFADHAVVLENGRSVLAGRAAELRQRADIKTHYLGGSSRDDQGQRRPREAVA
ncbi:MULTISPECIES: ABC transporter ATP-binding protein [Bradyrhizobium]|uniref:ABC transporter ATP-binding protein n=1 Tax=Bradyrhizobium TaxID=374 RepID=UPI0008419ECB|nr:MULTISPECIES: ABC transporter ATP-binding protein [Bradyrhizobium]MCP1838886.1 branched-chain amino acid transport system ATP-binding protein [Bradyrhizobium sp. USDA 4538]MCP1899453.1 branched-chain amino acid transport system ATP-binding protein [Bradyrhizobium sp. USDA 4537]MCP1909730.1 branched-chain amino acid transport system ATP-binding protein [Bradyrhizobium elkanii]MCP1986436.1 branched-chain amino acid transport system ATP-binding protein [Bradyrhizobium sp. USDA 4539]ODM75154.1 